MRDQGLRLASDKELSRLKWEYERSARDMKICLPLEPLIWTMPLRFRFFLRCVL